MLLLNALGLKSAHFELYANALCVCMIAQAASIACTVLLKLSLRIYFDKKKTNQLFTGLFRMVVKTKALSFVLRLRGCA